VGFAAITHGLLRLDEWRERRRVEGRLAFNSAGVGKDARSDGFVIGVHLVSSASFPIEFDIRDFRTRLGETVPKQLHTPTKLIMPSLGLGWHNDHPIILSSLPKGETVEGFVEFEIFYGVPGRLKYKLQGKKRVIAVFNNEGLLTGSNWQEAG
jgi:hypothetical protein